jgi:hypothetical protein
MAEQLLPVGRGIEDMLCICCDATTAARVLAACRLPFVCILLPIRKLSYVIHV